jgi:hypothetical protein
MTLPDMRIETTKQTNKQKEKLTSSAEIHWMADGVVSVDAERHQDVRRRIRDQNLI